MQSRFKDTVNIYTKKIINSGLHPHHSRRWIYTKQETTEHSCHDGSSLWTTWHLAHGFDIGVLAPSQGRTTPWDLTRTLSYNFYKYPILSNKFKPYSHTIKVCQNRGRCVMFLIGSCHMLHLWVCLIVIVSRSRQVPVVSDISTWY